jgi:hypothetical protein
MKNIIFAACLAMPLAPAGGAAAQPAVAVSSKPVTVEYYYRIKWGQHGAFKELYDRNHAPILKEMQKRGFITAIRTHEPYTHMAGGPRWDLRVTLSYRDAEAAAGSNPGGYEDVATEVTKALFPDKAKFEAEEARRMGMLEEHWDVIVFEVTK